MHVYIHIAPKELLKLVNFKRHIAGIIIYGRNQNHRFPDCVSVSHLVVWLYYHLLVSILGYNGIKLIYSVYVLIHRGISSYIFIIIYYHISSCLSWFISLKGVFLHSKPPEPMGFPNRARINQHGLNKKTSQVVEIPSWLVKSQVRINGLFHRSL